MGICGEASTRTKHTKKMKDVYLVSKQKFYSEATEEELRRDISMACPDDDLHRIVQCKVRYVHVL
jgi:hypothetical protein